MYPHAHVPSGWDSWRPRSCLRSGSSSCCWRCSGLAARGGIQPSESMNGRTQSSKELIHTIGPDALIPKPFRHRRCPLLKSPMMMMMMKMPVWPLGLQIYRRDFSILHLFGQHNHLSQWGWSGPFSPCWFCCWAGIEIIYINIPYIHQFQGNDNIPCIMITSNNSMRTQHWIHRFIQPLPIWGAKPVCFWWTYAGSIQPAWEMIA